MNRVEGSIALAVFIAAIFWFGSCKRDDLIQPHVASVELKVAGVECTDALLRVSLTDPAQPRTIGLKRDGQTVLIIQLLNSDSLLIDEGLLPRHTYSYTAVRIQDTTEVDVSAPAQLTTMDTTSGSFTWTTDTLGEGFSNVLSDVAIINDTLAYAVGELYLRDTAGQIDPHRYNLAIWKGMEWKLRRLTYQGSPPEIRSVFAFSLNDVWFDPWFHWNGQIFQEMTIDPIFHGVGVNKMWGGEGQLYVAGDNGFIASRSANGAWGRVESGTRGTIYDVWGGTNPLLGGNAVVAAVGWLGTPGETKFLVLRGATSQVETLAWPNQLSPRMSIWFDRNSRIYTCGSGVYVSSNNGWRCLSDLPLAYTWMVRGNGPNDVVVCGEDGLLMHFNGSTWRTYAELSLSFGRFYSVAIKGDLVIAVGWSGNRAAVAVGRR